MSGSVAETQPWTIGRLLQVTKDFLAAKGLEQPQLCAQLLISHVLSCRRLDLYLQIDRVLAEDQLSTLRDLVRRSGQHEPIAYLVGHKEFFSLDFVVTPDVLIPRPETETLVQAALDLSRGKTPPVGRILDLCTGTGCVAVAMATHLPDSQLVATDASDGALRVAEENLRRHKLLDRVSLRQGDLFDALGPQETEFDLIVSNPPYIPTGQIDTLSTTVAGYEPRTALDGGADGLALVRRIIAGAADRLRPAGTLAIEVGYDQGKIVRELLVAAGYVEARAVRDGLGHERVIMGVRPA